MTKLLHHGYLKDSELIYALRAEILISFFWWSDWGTETNMISFHWLFNEKRKFSEPFSGNHC